jgi:hypothetical protein
MPSGEPESLEQSLGLEPEVAEKTEERLQKAQLAGVLVDDKNQRVTVLTKGTLGPRIAKALPNAIGDVTIEYLGGAGIESNPPEPIPPNQLTSPPCWLHKGCLACGSSVTVAPVHGAGTLGCLVADEAGKLHGLTNNHVTGDCNHTQVGMYVLSPAPMDAAPNGPAPRAIGRHARFIPLQSGDPQQVTRQEIDAAIFEVIDAQIVSSMQGIRYDTPKQAAPLVGNTVVKKIGRTTGETYGRVKGEFLHPVRVPYKSPRFSSTVYFRNVYGVVGVNNSPFSAPGDSGSLVVSDDGKQALGLLFGGNEMISLVMPLEPILKVFKVSLVSGHNV